MWPPLMPELLLGLDDLGFVPVGPVRENVRLIPLTPHGGFVSPPWCGRPGLLAPQVVSRSVSPKSAGYRDLAGSDAESPLFVLTDDM